MHAKISCFTVYIYKKSRACLEILLKECFDNGLWEHTCNLCKVQVSSGSQVAIWPGHYINVRHCGVLSMKTPIRKEKGISFMVPSFYL